MKRWCVLILCVAAMVLCWYRVFLIHEDQNVEKAVMITLMTIFYHVNCRMIWGFIIGHVPLSWFHPEKDYYRVREREQSFYELIKVKKWKNHMPVFDRSLWDIQNKSLDEILRAGCQAEMDHVGNMILSYLTIFFAIPYQSFWVFFFTAVGAAGFDFCFVVIQRYNRPRLMRVMKREQRLEANS